MSGEDFMDVDIESLTDDQLDAIQRETTVEQQRRAFLEGIPLQVADLAEQYRAGGGDQAALENAIATH